MKQLKPLKQTYGNYIIINRRGVYEVHNAKDSSEEVRCYSDKAFAVKVAQRLASQQANAAAAAYLTKSR